MNTVTQDLAAAGGVALGLAMLGVCVWMVRTAIRNRRRGN
jgi:hypothetical protein